MVKASSARVSDNAVAQRLKPLINGQSKKKIRIKYGRKFFDYLIDATNLSHFNLFEDFVQMMLENINFYGKMLDFGCGFGLHALLLSPHCQKVAGIDIKPSKIAIFKKLIRETGVRNVEAQTADGQNLPFASNTFDLVYCHESLSHVEEINRALREIRRVLREKGRIIVADTKRWHPYGIWMIYIKGNKEENYFNIWVMKQLLKRAGFANIQRVKNITAPRNPLRRWNRQFWWLNKFIDPKYVLIGRKEVINLDKKIYKQELKDWNRNADYYVTEADSPFKEILRKEMKDKFLLSEKHRLILDLGASAGDFAFYLNKNLGSEVICLDFSPEMKKAAKKKYPHLQYLTASAHQLPFKDSTFNAIIASGILHHLKAQGILKKSLEEICRVLKTGGYFCYLDRSSSFLAIIHEKIISSIKNLFSKTRKNYPASSTSLEVSLTRKDLEIIRKDFNLIQHAPIGSIPFKFLMVFSNFLLYFVGKKLYMNFQKLFYPLAFFFEKYINFKFWETEYCEVLRKEK